MVPFIFASEQAEATGIGALGISAEAFVVQLITFVIVVLLFNKFAVKPIVKMLEERRQVIDDGVKMGLKLEEEKARQEKEIAEIKKEARIEADKIVATGHKEAREVMRESEKTTARKVESMLAEADTRIHEESDRARRGLEKDIVGLISEATEALVGEKVDPKKDAELIDKILKGRNK